MPRDLTFQRAAAAGAAACPTFASKRDNELDR